MEEQCFFKSGSHKIEGLIDKGNSETGIIITHPHPLYGGNMHNHIVELLYQVFKNKGYTTLRFNFRGVGRSQGQYDNGVGEQKDLFAAIEFLIQRGVKQIDMAGYSFGAWVNALAVQEKDNIHGMTMVSPPVAFVDFSHISTITCLNLVIGGREDEIAPVGLIETMLPVWNKNARFKIIEGADHFYTGCLDQLKSALDSTE